jgi:N-acetylglutamate synthase-like GNAT family acetyltransferase
MWINLIIVGHAGGTASMNIRRFKEEDASKVSSIIESCFTELDIGGHTERGRRLQIKRNQPEVLIEKAKTTKYFVAMVNHTVVGICGYGEGEVRTLFIDVDHQGKGFGKALLAKVLSDAEKEGVTELFTWSTFYAEKLYSSFGFKRKREIFLPEGCKDIILIEMWKNFAEPS